MSLINQSRKAIAAGLVAGAAAFQAGQSLSVSVAIGVGAAAAVWALPNEHA